MSAKKLDDSERKAVLLRTSADVASHALTQIDCLAKDWPEYASGASGFREFVEKMVVHAREHGYIEKRGRV